MHRRSLFGLAALTLGVGACSRPEADGPAASHTRPGGYAAGTEIKQGGWPLPTTVLTDQHGTKQAVADWAKQVTLVFFGYSNCPDVCTGILADLASALQRMDAGQREQVRVLLITTDPARDTPKVLGEYLSRIDPGFFGLTGPLAEITRAATSLGVNIEEAKKLPSGGYEVVHGTQVIGFGADKRAQVVWTEGTSVANYRTDIEILLGRQ